MINTIFTKEIIQHYKDNKDLITSELLESIRSHGNEGKQIALDILDLPKDNEQYYLDSFGNKITQNGNRRLKKPFTKLDLSPIHEEEIKKCAEDIHYFKDNYVKIKTKKGVNFPELRNYQNDFIDEITPDENESIIGLMGRQSGKSISTAIYLSHTFIFNKEMNIGIVANKGAMAREFLSNTKNILVELPIWLQVGITTWNKSFIEAENGMRILTDVPSSDAFRGFAISILIVDETAFIRTSVYEEFADSIFPSQSGLAFKKNILLSTANGMNHFYALVKGARAGTNGYKIFEVDWKDVPRYKPDGTLKTTNEFFEEITAKHGHIYFQQNYGNDFIGSSHTLLSSDILKELKPSVLEDIRDNKLRIYHRPIKGHQYIMTVDAAKDGIDAFSINVTDITNFTFKQVATAKLQIDYLLMPEFINEWCEYYYHPYLIIENNEGAGQSVADQMHLTYEYENLHFDKSTETKGKKKKSYPGTRTTSKSRKQILQTMKTFIENNNYEINDEDTIKEFFTFVLINNKYQADDSCHDDMIMALALTFTLFNDTKNFEDMKEISKLLFSELEEREEVDMMEILTVGGFDDGTEENNSFQEQGKSKVYTNYEEYLDTQDGFH